MSDLATFVAAALRDKTIVDLMEENRKLQERVRSTMTVEVTGPQRKPIYARGKLDHDGDYHSNNSNLWNVVMSEQLTPCRHRDLGGVEIWIGDSLKAGFDDYFFQFYDNCDYDKDSNSSNNTNSDSTDQNNILPDEKKERVYSICFSPGAVWVDLNIGWTTEELDAANLPLPPYFEDVDGTTGLNHLRESLPNVNDSKVCKFLSVCPAVRGIKGLVQSIPGKADPKAVVKRRQDEERILEEGERELVILQSANEGRTIQS